MKKRILSTASVAVTTLVSSVIVFLLFLPACNQVIKTGPNEIVKLTLTQQASVEKLNSSRLFSSVKCIALATGEESLVGEIVKIVRREGYIYVADREALYRFTEEGVFSGKISKQGNGPDEYTGISDFEIESTDRIWILNRNMLRLYAWNGALIKQIKLDVGAAKMYLIAPGKMCLYIGNERVENNQHQVKIIDLDTENILSNHLEIDENRATYLHIQAPNHFCPRDEGKGVAYFYNLFDEHIYALSEDGIEKRFQMDMFGKNIPASFYEAKYNDVGYFFQALFSHDYAYGTVFFMECRNVYLYSCLYGGKSHLAFISKKTNESVVDFTTLVEDRVLEGYPIDLTENRMHVQGNHEIIIPLYPSDIMEYGESHPELRDRIKEAIHYENEEQNAVLLTIRIKDEI
ncbi:MAG: 6-bladed beta-propeller [Tannerella sp.]|jgi:hypothetical protein|nr:6-bladed beta-propeller [Tannerella sp.]